MAGASVIKRGLWLVHSVLKAGYLELPATAESERSWKTGREVLLPTSAFQSPDSAPHWQNLT